MTHRRAVVVVFAVALVVRLALVLPFANHSVTTPLSSDFTTDARAYVDIARSLVAHGTFGYGGRPSAFRPPLYPALLAATFAVAGESYRTVRVLQALIGALGCCALFGLGRLMYGARAAWLGGLALAVYPFAVYFTGELMTEALYMTLGLVAALAVAWTWTAPSLGRGTLAGLALGVAALCRPPAIGFGLVLLVSGLWAALRGRRDLGRALVVAVAVAAVVIAPWIVRNSLLFGRPVFLATYTGLNLYKGLPGKDDVSSDRDFGYDQHMIEDPGVGSLPKPEPDIDAEQRAYWAKAVQERPFAYLGEKLFDLRRFWFDFHLAGPAARLSRWLQLGAAGFYLAALGLALLATRELWRRGGRLAVLFPWAIALSTMLMYVPFFAGKRFRIATVDPQLLLLAAWWLGERVRRQTPGSHLQ